MFLLIEKLFRKETKVFATKINDKCIIETAMQDPNLLQFYENLCSIAEIKIDKEISFNLLENLLGLFVRVRSHIYAHIIKERHKLKVNGVKKHSLRTELKKRRHKLRFKVQYVCILSFIWSTRKGDKVTYY